MLQVVWFKRDLRIADHTQLAETARNRPVLPLYVAEPELWQQPDGALRRWAFTVECLAELRDDRGKLGQPLIVRAGDIVETLDRLRRQVPGLRLLSHEETGSGWTYARDERVRAWARANAVDWTEQPQFGIVRGLRDRCGWAGKWDRRMAGDVVGLPDGLPTVSGVDLGHIPRGHRPRIAA
jgi:deoxyribodipyrimidine photo-lyase